MLACRSRARTGPRATQPGFPASRPVLVAWHSNLYLNGRRNAHSNPLFPGSSAPDTVRHRLQGLGQAAFVDLAAAADRLRRASLRRLRWPCGLIPGGKPPHPPRQGPRSAATPRTRQRTASSPRPRPSQPQSGIPTTGQRLTSLELPGLSRRAVLERVSDFHRALRIGSDVSADAASRRAAQAQMRVTPPQFVPCVTLVSGSGTDSFVDPSLGCRDAHYSRSPSPGSAALRSRRSRHAARSPARFGTASRTRTWQSFCR